MRNHNELVKLTQDEMVCALADRKHCVTARQLSRWRKLDLLPPFDYHSKGQGRGLGRSSPIWSDGARVLNQIIEVIKLLQICRSYDALYVPLWLQDYPVPVARVRQVLHQPLGRGMRVTELDGAADENTEDMIGEVLETIIRKLRKRGRLVWMPEQVVEALLNIFFNRDYTINDAPFEEALQALKDCDRFNPLKNEQSNVAHKLISCIAMELITTNGEKFTALVQFFKKYLSLYPLQQAVDECTDSELMIVRQDLYQLGGILKLVYAKIARWLCSKDVDVPVREADLLPVVWGYAVPLMWFDLSLQRNGYTKFINPLMLWARSKL